MQYFNGTQVIDGTGQRLWDRMYSIAILDVHNGKQIWQVIRQTSDSTSALYAYLDERKYFGDSKIIAVIRPGDIVELNVVENGE